jgi:hypothetical protein
MGYPRLQLRTIRAWPRNSQQAQSKLRHYPIIRDIRILKLVPACRVRPSEAIRLYGRCNMKRFTVTALGLFCLILAGCVEGEMTYTVNPDGSAKVKIDVVSVVPPPLFGGTEPNAKKPEEETLDDIRRRAIRSTLEMRGVAAWKGVSAEFLPNGKLKFIGTAYVKRLTEFDSTGGIPLLTPTLAAERGADGSLKLSAKRVGKDGPTSSNRKPKTPDEIKKMADDELDQYILRDLIELQSGKSLIVAILGDMKLKATFLLPGDATAVTGFERDGRKVSFTFDGNKILAAMNKSLDQDRAGWRKLYREAASADAVTASILGFPSDDLSVSVAKPGEPQFDFEKEVKEARGAYPELRKRFGFGDDLKLPTGEEGPKK